MSSEALAAAQRKFRAIGKEAVDEQSKARLKTVVARKFRTCFIFPLSEFETAFGELWGHGLKESELNCEQRINRAKWESVRMKILNTGNTQSRAVQAEIDLHHVQFQGYVLELRGESGHDNQT